MKRKSLYILICLSFVFASGDCYGEDLEFVRGGFVFDLDVKGDPQIDHGREKYKYPVISGDYLVFIRVDRRKKPYLSYYTYHLPRLLDLGLKWVVKDSERIVYPTQEHAQMTGFGKEKYPDIKAILPHMTFLKENESGRLQVHEVLKPDNDPVVPTESSVHYFLREKRANAWATEKGLYLKNEGKALFPSDEGTVYSFDIKNKLLAVSYKAPEERVCIKTSMPGGLCQKTAFAPGETEPKFSDSGRFLATAIKDEHRSQINIYAVNMDGTFENAGLPISTIDGIEFSHKTPEDFLYFGSYEWLGDDLYFIKPHRSASTGVLRKIVFKVVCEENDVSGKCGDPIPLEPKDCITIRNAQKVISKPPSLDDWRPGNPAPDSWKDIVWAPGVDDACQKSGGSPKWDAKLINILIRRLVWVQPYKDDQGHTHLVVQAVVKTEFKRRSSNHWLDRILIFKEVSDEGDD